MKRSGIYQIRNLQNHKFYIGSTTRLFSQRKSEHWRDLRKNKHCTQHLQRAWNKYGKDAFIFEVIEICQPDLCEKREQHYLDTLHPQYNGSKFAANPKGYKWSDESKAKVSGKNNHQYGKLKSDTTKTRISATKTGICLSDITKQRMSKTRRQTKMYTGENNPSAQLTEKLVKEIRNTYQNNKISYTQLARQYNIDRRTASRICHNQIWNHI